MDIYIIYYSLLLLTCFITEKAKDGDIRHYLNSPGCILLCYITYNDFLQ